MSLFDFFFYDYAQAAALGKIADEAERANQLRAAEAGGAQLQLQRRVRRLEHDVGALALVVASILKKLDEKGHVTRDEVKEVIKKLDLLDKVSDGKITVEDLGRGDFFEHP
jgi:hypothetical protein